MGWRWRKNKNKEDEKLKNSAKKVITQEELEALARRADEADEKKYKTRHALYDFSKSIVGFFRNIFGKKVTIEDEVRKAGDLALTERQLVSLGGTKPMSQYIGTDGSQWLAKQAVNCMGFYKISGVLLTTAGAKVQRLVDPDTAVDAFHGKTIEDGEVSFQRRIPNTVSSKEFSLFKFSKHPELATKQTIKKIEGLGNQILREHITDWLLCNFDTKGENFILSNGQKGWVLHGIDKEAAFSKLDDPKAQHMSTEYKPHANNTLYNVVFSMFKEGKLNLDLTVMKDKINEIVKMDPDEYMNSYDAYLENEKKQDPKKYAETYMKIRERKQSLGEEYNKFFTDLVKERIKNVPEEAEALREKYFEGGESCKLFSPKDRSPWTEAQDRVVKLREQTRAKIAQGKISRETIAELATVIEVQKNLKGYAGRGMSLKEQAMFTNSSIARRKLTWITNDFSKAILERVRSGEIKASELEREITVGIETTARVPGFKETALNRQRASVSPISRRTEINPLAWKSQVSAPIRESNSAPGHEPNQERKSEVNPETVTKVNPVNVL